jgi:hypothetical protein
MTPFIIVRVSFAGSHFWPDAPPVVGFLRSEHRHIFTVEGKLRVDGLDRAVEFFVLKNEMEKALSRFYPFVDEVGVRRLGASSCESIARQFADEFGFESCVVFEDGENGGGVER